MIVPKRVKGLQVKLLVNIGLLCYDFNNLQLTLRCPVDAAIGSAGLFHLRAMCNDYIMRLTVYLLICTRLLAATVHTNPIAPSSQRFFSYSPVTQPTAPPGTQLLLTFPNQATGSQLMPTNCATYSALQYNHFTYDGVNWTGPLSGPVYAYFTMFDAITHTSSGWAGLSANVTFGGQIGSNSDTTTQDFIQSVYFSTDNCYEYGPEVGFYRLLFHPGDPTEQGTLYFYYGLNVNCYNIGGLGSCRNKSTGASLQYDVSVLAITLPATNSHSGTNFIYGAYLSSASNFHVTITDPYTQALLYSHDMAVDSFFASTANTMFTSGLSGYITSTQQRNSVLGGITDSMSNPLKLTIYGLAQLALLAAPPAAQGRQGISGWCQQGGVTVYAPSASGGSPTSRAFQRSYPACTVDVYATGTTTHVPIYSNNSGTSLSNPFTAVASGALAGFWQFFADNGIYDVKFSGGGIPAPFTVSSNTLFDFSTWIPTDFFALHEIGVYGAGGSPFTLGFIGPAGLTGSTAWTLPAADAAGCLASNGLTQLSFITCQPGGSNTQVQYNNSGSFAGSANFTWDNAAQSVTITGIAATPALRVNTGFTQSAGFFSNANSWQGFNTSTDGALLRGLNVAPTVAATTGGYINMAPLGYGDTALPLTGLGAFGTHSAVIWVAATNPAAPDTTYGVNTNLFISAAGGFKSANTLWNTIQAPVGGMFASSFTASGYVQTGHHNGPPPATSGDTFNAGAQYYDDLLGPQVFNGSSWVTIGSGGGGGSPGGPNGSVQYNAGGSFAGSANLAWDNFNHFLFVTSVGTGTAGFVNLVGFAQAENGFLAANIASPTTRLNYNVIQAPHGGVAALSFTGSRDGGGFGGYVQVGNGAGVPTAMPGDSFHAGSLYYDTAAHSLQLFNDSAAWVTVSTGGATAPGAPNTSVQFNSGGSFAGSANLTYASQLLTSVAVDAVHAGMAVSTGFMQAATGFLASGGTSASPLNYNAIQAPQGGLAGLSLTMNRNANGFGGYVQVGNGTGVPTVLPTDAFHAGAMYYDNVATCLELYNGSTWSCVSSGGGGSPAGPSTSVQYNNAGSFGGSANLTWNNATQVLGSTEFSAAATGSNITFQNGNSNFSVNGNGDISFVGIATTTGASGGFNITGDISAHSFQTIGGISVGASSSGFGVYQINGVTVIDNGKNFVGSSVTIGTGASFDATGASSSAFNTFDIFKGKFTAGRQLPAIYYDYSSSSNTGNISTTQVTYGGGALAAGTYRINVVAVCIYPGSGGIGGTVTFSMGSVPDGNFVAVTDTGSCATSPVMVDKSYVLYTNATTSTGCNGICWSTTASGFTNETYRMSVTAERLQ